MACSMAAPDPIYLTASAGPSRSRSRTPKLSYRTKSSGTESVETFSTDVSRATASTDPTTASIQPECPTPRYPSSDIICSSSSRSPSIAPSSLSTKTTEKSLKKKQSFFSGLFSMKEPSAQALIDYQRQLQKQGSIKDGRPKPVGLAGVSTATLPPTVPKVNSKWDGVPRSAREKEKRKELGTRHSMMGLSRDIGTAKSGSSGTSESSSLRKSKSGRGRPGSVMGGMSAYSGNSGNHLVDLYGWEATQFTSGGSPKYLTADRPKSSHRATSSQSAPPLQSTSFFLVDAPEPPQIPSTYLELSPPSASSSPHPPGHSYSPSATPRDRSPITPIEQSPLTDPKSHPSEKTLLGSEEGMRTTTLEAPSNFDEVIVRSSGFGILSPPAAGKRKPNPALYSPHEKRPNTAVADLELNSILKRTSIHNQQQFSFGTPSITPHPTQNPGLTQRPAPKRANSARDRLGMTMSVKTREAIAPWYTADQEAAKEERILTPTPEGGHLLRRKSRLLFFKK